MNVYVLFRPKGKNKNIKKINGAEILGQQIFYHMQP